MRLNEFQITENFSLREFQCPSLPHHHLAPQAPAASLQKLREAWGKPVTVTSGYPCARHNAEVGGVPNSRHMRGLAADAAVPRAEQEKFRELARAAGFSKILPYPARNFVHLEINDE